MFYQVAIPELNKYTSVDQCAYMENGLTDTFKFVTDRAGQLISFVYQSTEQKSKLNEWTTYSSLEKLDEGPRPFLSVYDLGLSQE